MPEYQIQIYTPRWGHNDTYTVSMSRDVMRISMGARAVSCTYVENLDPEWNGDIFQIFVNDHIYAPKIIPDLFERLWLAWRDGQMVDVQAELEAIADWLNAVTDAKPNTEFWNIYF